MSLTNSPFWMASTGSDFYNHEITNSIRFAESSYINRTFSSGGNRKTFTYSTWIKRSDLSRTEVAAGMWSGESWFGRFSTSNRIVCNFTNNTGVNYFLDSGPIFRDNATWYHIMYAVDTTQATSSNRVKLYVNGTQISFTNSGYPPQNYDTDINVATQHRIGSENNRYYYKGYTAETHFVDGQQLSPTDFGETKNGVWIPKEYTGSYGTTGFYLKFNGNANDSSGNGNNFSTSGVQSYDYTPDSPTQNLNQCAKDDDSGPGALIEGGLRSYITSQGNYYSIGTTIGVKNGKWYWESRSIKGGNNDSSLPSQGFMPDGKYCANLSSSAPPGKISINVGTQDGSDGVYMIAADLDNGYIYRGRNGTWSNGATESGIESGSGTGAVKTLTAAERNQLLRVCVTHRHDTGTSNCLFNFGQDSTLEGYTTAGNNADGNGFGDFKYSPPSGFLAICSRNLPDPDINPENDEKPEDYFNIIKWVGDNTNNRALTGVGFQPDLVIAKSRDANSGVDWVDAVRGGTKNLRTTSTDAEATTNTVISFQSDGFTVGDGNGYDINKSGENVVGWCWLAGNGTSSNTNGSLTSTVSANTKAGFSIVEYTGTGSAETIGHGLDEPPEFIILKERNASDNWSAYAEPLGNTYKLRPNGGNARIGPSNNLWNGTSPTSTVFSIGTDGELNGNVIAYCFHSVDGYSKFGSYEGNGSTDGPYIITGFRPAFLVLKRYDAGGDSWAIFDNRRSDYNELNQIDRELGFNDSSPEYNRTNANIDFLSNGFKLRNSDGWHNSSGGDYVYMAFAEMPTKFANAR